MSIPDHSLAGNAAVVTGAGRGIGRAIAIGYARAGAAICCAARTESEIQETAALIHKEGGTALAVQTDVTQWLTVQKLFDAADSELGGIDIAILNAGINTDQKIVQDSAKPGGGEMVSEGEAILILPSIQSSEETTQCKVPSGKVRSRIGLRN